MVAPNDVQTNDKVLTICIHVNNNVSMHSCVAEIFNRTEPSIQTNRFVTEKRNDGAFYYIVIRLPRGNYHIMITITQIVIIL